MLWVRKTELGRSKCHPFATMLSNASVCYMIFWKTTQHEAGLGTAPCWANLKLSLDVWKQPLSLVSTSQSSSELTYFTIGSFPNMKVAKKQQKIVVFFFFKSKCNHNWIKQDFSWVKLGALSDQNFILFLLCMNHMGSC